MLVENSRTKMRGGERKIRIEKRKEGRRRESKKTEKEGGEIKEKGV